MKQEGTNVPEHADTRHLLIKGRMDMDTLDFCTTPSKAVKVGIERNKYVWSSIYLRLLTIQLKEWFQKPRNDTIPSLVRKRKPSRIPHRVTSSDHSP